MAYEKECGQDGFTLLEQIMVTLIAAVLLTIAVPSMHGFIRKHRLQSAQTDYIAGLRYARDVAATRGVRTIFCPSRDNRTCQGAWSEGWMVGLDPDAKGQPSGEPLHIGGNDISQLNVMGSDSKKLVRFQPNGSAGGANQSFVLCQRGDSREALLVVISNYGRIRGDVASAEQASSCAAAN